MSSTVLLLCLAGVAATGTLLWLLFSLARGFRPQPLLSEWEGYAGSTPDAQDPSNRTLRCETRRAAISRKRARSALANGRSRMTGSRRGSVGKGTHS